MAWSNQATLLSAVSVTTEQVSTATIEECRRAQINHAITFPASPTDDGIVSVYAMHGTTQDTEPFLQYRVPKVDNSTARGTVIFDAPTEFVVGVSRSGSTDTLTATVTCARDEE